MLFKLSFKNMKKSLKDYTIYFLTLVLGVAIFYLFNSLDSQQAMLEVSRSQKEIIHLLIDLLGYVSVFVAVVLGLLIVYANNFLINRRKKEFGIYMTLGMGRRQISKIILLETIFVGIISLVIGLVVGVFASQFMSILVAKLFQADMSTYQFAFSQGACIKTIIYFAVMYLAVMVFNTFTISRYKLINLLNATKKNEKVKMKNPILSVLVFLVGTGVLGYAYWQVTGGIQELTTVDKILPPILMGIVSTVLIFWSLSGFVLQMVKTRKKIYLKDTNMFVLRQINNKINTTIISISVICLMLFMAISVLSTALALRNNMQAELTEMTPVDLNLYKTANLPESYMQYKKVVYTTEEQREDSKHPVSYTLINNGLDMDVLKDVIEFPIYATEELNLGNFLGDQLEEAKAQFPFVAYDILEDIIKVSDYNKVAKLYGIQQFDLSDNEYIVLCNYDNIKAIRDKTLSSGNTKRKIAGKEYVSKYTECQDGFVEMAGSHVNTGIILVPDSCLLPEETKEKYFLVANYNAKTAEEKEKIEENFRTGGLVESLEEAGLQIDGNTKINVIESSNGLASIITFIAIYLGIIFLIASSAILALKQLTESADNKQRYTILRKIGCDEKMINRALFRQIGIFFGLPLILGIIHSIFGIQFALNIMAAITQPKELLPSTIATAALISVIYGAYFLATYLGSKNIIKEEE